MSNQQRPPYRLLASVFMLSAWMLLLFAGWTIVGAVHLLLLGAFALFPWRKIGRKP